MYQQILSIQYSGFDPKLIRKNQNTQKPIHS
jgi:hypothetical protein